MKTLSYSANTKRSYDPNDCVRIVNIRQALFYMKKGVEILDFYPSSDFKTGDDILVFLVDKESSKKFYKEWLGYAN